VDKQSRRYLPLILAAFVGVVRAEQCQITSPLPLPISIAGCTYAPIVLPGGATSYIQNTSSLQSGATFYVSSGTANTFIDAALAGNGTKCVQTDNTGFLSVASGACSSGGGGASALAVTTGTTAGYTGAAISTPTAVVLFDSNTTNGQLLSNTTYLFTLRSDSVTLQGNSLGATYLTNSSATATYLQQSSATATYLQNSSATATYLQNSSATATYLQQSSATATYLQQSSATATYLQLSSATATYGQLKSTQTWTGQNSWTTPSPSSFTYAVNVGSVTGGGLGTCGDSTHGLGYNSSNQFTCQSITGSGGGGASTLAFSSGSAITSVIISSPTSNIVVDSNTFIANLQGTTTGVLYISSAAILYTSSATSTYLQQSSATATYLQKSSATVTYGNLASTQTWTGGNVFNSSSGVTTTNLVVISSAAIPTNSQNFGRSTLNQWFSQMASLQVPFTPLNTNKLSFFVIGDSHFSHNIIGKPFADWMYSNFGNAGTYLTLDDSQTDGDVDRPNGCKYIKSGSWINFAEQAAALGLDDDQIHTSTPTATLTGTCPGADQVILHYVSQPGAGKIDFSVDGANHIVLASSDTTLHVSSALITGLIYGVHTASISYAVSTTTGGIDVLDFVFFSSSTPGAIMYRAGMGAQPAASYLSQDQTQYQNLLKMLPSTPSVVMAEFGVNESITNVSTTTYIANVRALVQRFRNVFPQIDCAYMSPPDYIGSASHTYPIQAYSTALLNASVTDGCAIVDFSSYFSSEPFFSSYYNADGIHLNAQGGQVGGQIMVNTFGNNVNNITPFTYNASSGVIALGNDQSTNTLRNVTAIGSNIVISSGIANSGAIGVNLTISSNNVFLIGGATGSGAEQTLKIASITVSAINWPNGTVQVASPTAGGGSGGLVSLSTGIITPAIFTSSVTVQSSMSITGNGGFTSMLGIIGSTLTLTNSTSPNTLVITSNSTGINLVQVSSVVAINPSDYILTIASPTAATPLIWGVNLAGHVVSSGTTPTVSSCGTTPTISTGSTDTNGRVTWTGVATTCTVTFGTPFAATPFCIVNSTGPAVGVTQPPAATGPVFNFSTITGGTLTYHCEGGRSG